MENLANDLENGLKKSETNNEEIVVNEGEFFSEPDDDDDSFTGQKASCKENIKQNDEEAAIMEKEKLLSDFEKEKRKSESLKLKDLGNSEFKSGNYENALNYYTDALSVCLLIHNEERAILYSNRAAAYIKLSKDIEALEDSVKAVTLNPNYVRARLRRAELYEKVEKLDEALEDYQKVLEQDPGQHSARAACMRLPEQIKVRNEKMKDEMIDKLKELGNMVLRPFGLSTNNFKLQQDPNTGSYSINFQQNPTRNA